MEIEVLDNADAAAKRAAQIIAAAARESVAERGRFVMAVSGGRSPWQMLRDLMDNDVPWEKVEIAQVDERVAPAGDPDRNLTHMMESLQGAPLRPGQIHAMPVELPNLQNAASEYAATLEQLAGEPPVIDLIHLGLGADGHTASLVPGDPVLDVSNANVAATGVYQGRRRLTLTFPLIDRALKIVFLVTGSDKREALAKLRVADPSIPAGRVRQQNAVIIADQAATGK